MSIELFTQEQIVNHVENSSPTKFMYSFGRAERFPKLKRSGKSDTFYNLPSTKMRRTASFGFGTRSDFTKNRKNTEFISIRRDFDKGNQRGLKFSFGIGRDYYKKTVCPGCTIIDKNIPGPGKYNVVGELGADSVKYSMHPKLEYGGWVTKSKNMPSPGDYHPVIQINPEGKYPSSLVENIRRFDFGISNTSRWNNFRSKKYYLIKIFL